MLGLLFVASQRILHAGEGRNRNKPCSDLQTLVPTSVKRVII
jgi:hypothetical protein